MGFESLWDLSYSLNLQRKNEYHIMTKVRVLFLFGPPEGHEAPIFGNVWILNVVFFFSPQVIRWGGVLHLPYLRQTHLTSHSLTLLKLIVLFILGKMKLELGFFSDIIPQLILTTGSWDRLPVHLVTMVTMGPVCLMKVDQNTWFFS